MQEIIKEYTNNEVTIVWKPALCTHASFCWRELPQVFNPQNRPWTNPLGASTKRIIKQVERCPSGALTYYMNDKKQEDMKTEESGMNIKIIHNGPLIISDNITVIRDGKNNEAKSNGAAFCRCGKSKNQPYCDGSHMNFPFED